MTGRLVQPPKQTVLRAAATVALAIGVVASGALAPAAAGEQTIVHRDQQVSVTNEGTTSTTRESSNDGGTSTTRVSSNDGGTATTTVRQSSKSSSNGHVRVKRLRNEVEVKNRRDGRVKVRSDFEFDKTSRPAVHAINTALAFASCVDCRTAAIAFQVVLAEGTVALSADNHAAAINDRCTTCDTLAAAYQFVVVGGGEVSLTRSGRSQLRGLDRDLRDLRRSEATGAELAAAAEALAGQVLAVLQSEVVLEPSDALAPLSRSAGVSVELHREVDANPAP